MLDPDPQSRNPDPKHWTKVFKFFLYHNFLEEIGTYKGRKFLTCFMCSRMVVAPAMSPSMQYMPGKYLQTYFSSPSVIEGKSVKKIVAKKTFGSTNFVIKQTKERSESKKRIEDHTSCKWVLLLGMLDTATISTCFYR